MKVGEYQLVNDEKLDRAINGNLTQGGKLIGGVGLDATDEQILAEYDKLGGLIKKDGLKVKQGCFWDVEEKKAFEEFIGNCFCQRPGSDHVVTRSPD